MIATLLLLYAFQAADGEWVEVRFYRVHLINGNFIDGQLLKDDAKGAILKMKAGEMTIRRDMIDRVEFVKMKDRFQAPIITTVPSPPKDAVKAFGLPANLAADLIGRRPDIVAARLRAEAAARRIDVAHANFYPNITIDRKSVV